MTTPAPGWYPDPHVPHQFRWWSGSVWTEHVAPVQPPAGSDLTWLLPVGRPWQAIVAGYSGLIGIVAVFLFPVSIGAGVWGLSEIKKKGTIGKGRCWFGIASGIWNLVFWALLIASYE